MPDTSALLPALDAALHARRGLIARLAAEQTDAYRLFHGTVEGQPGLTVDRYGSLILVQSFHGALAADDEAAVAAFYQSAFAGTDVIYNDRSHAKGGCAVARARQYFFAKTPGCRHKNLLSSLMAPVLV